MKPAFKVILTALLLSPLAALCAAELAGKRKTDHETRKARSRHDRNQTKRTKPQSSNWFRKVVTGGASKIVIGGSHNTHGLIASPNLSKVMTCGLLAVWCLMPASWAESDADWDAEKYFFRIIHVTPNGTGDGRSWEKAISLQRFVDRAKSEDAILNAKGAVPCDRLWLSRGEHRLNKRLYANKDFHVSILGGFAGNETSASQRDPKANPTVVVLDGCQFLFTRWADHLTVDGLTIQNGMAECGGGIHIGGSLGGGQSILIQDVDFIGCTAVSGGAIYVQPATPSKTAAAVETRNLRIINCRFLNCASTSSKNNGGGAIFIDKTSPADIDGVLLRGCEFKGNRSAATGKRDRGGAAVLVRAPYLRHRPVCLEYCLFEDNRCVNSDGQVVDAPGSAVAAQAAQLVVKDCVFVGERDDLKAHGPGRHEIEGNQFVASPAKARGIPPEPERGPVWAGYPDPGDAHWRDIIVTEEQRQLGRITGAQYELYQPSITYSVINKGGAPPHHGLYQHCAAQAYFDGKFYVVWQSNPTVRIEWASGRKIYVASSADFKVWSDPKLIAPDLPHVGGTQPMLMTAPNGELWCIWLCTAKNPEMRGIQISVLRPGSDKWVHRRMFPNERLDLKFSLYPQLNPWTLSSGRMIAPFIARLGENREPVGVFAYTDDDGQTWRLSNFIHGPQHKSGERTIWEIHGSEQIDHTIRVFGRFWNNRDQVLLTATGTGLVKCAPLVFENQAHLAGTQGYQNRPFVMPVRGNRYALVFPDAYADTLLARPASLYFSRSGRNDYVAGPSVSPAGAPCSYGQGIEHDGSIYIAFTDEMHDNGRDIRGAKISPSPDPNRFYLWPRRRDLGPLVSSPIPAVCELDGKTCVVFRGTGTAGVDTLPVQLEKGETLKVKFDLKVIAAPESGQCVLLSFGDIAEGRYPIRLGGPCLAKGKLGLSTGANWREAADFAVGKSHSLSLEFTRANLTVRVDTGSPLTFEATAGKMNPRLYLGEGVIVGKHEPNEDFSFAVALGSIRTDVLSRQNRRSNGQSSRPVHTMVVPK